MKRDPEYPPAPYTIPLPLHPLITEEQEFISCLGQGYKIKFVILKADQTSPALFCFTRKIGEVCAQARNLSVYNRFTSRHIPPSFPSVLSYPTKAIRAKSMAAINYAAWCVEKFNKQANFWERLRIYTWLFNVALILIRCTGIFLHSVCGNRRSREWICFNFTVKIRK